MTKLFSRLALAAACGAVIGLVSSAHAADKYVPPLVSDVSDAAAGKSKWTGLSVEAGLGVTSSSVDVGIVGFGSLLDSSSTDWAGHIGIGYDVLITPHIFVGVLARAQMSGTDYSTVLGKLGDRDIEYMIGGRIGWVPKVDGDWAVYGLVGYQFASIDVTGGPSTDQNSWVLGAGLEAMMTNHVFIAVEATANLADGETVSGTPFTLEATDYTGKVRLGYRF